MFRKLLWLFIFVMFYFWITESKENVATFKSAYQYVIGKLGKIDLELNVNSKSKKRKW